jgi:hypothetical protein
VNTTDRDRVLIGLTAAAADGLECPICGRPADNPSSPPTQPVGRSETGSQVFACSGRCVTEIALRQRGT